MGDSNPVTRTLCHTQVSSKTCSILWTIDNYTSVHETRGVSIVSSPFSSRYDDFKWVLYLTPNDHSSSDRFKRNVSLKLSPMLAEDELKKCCPISGTAKFCILDANNVETKLRNEKILIRPFANLAHTACIKLSDFVEETYLHNEDNRLLPNDKLTIFCEVSCIKNSDVVNIESQPFFNIELEERMPVCLESLRALFLNPEFSDVILHVNGENYPAHRNILALRSPVFKAMLMNDMQEKRASRIEIKDMSKEAFTEMLRCIYFGQPQNFESLVFELLAAADRYDLERLRNLCEKELYEKLSPKTAVNTLIMADMHHANTLKIQALQFIKMNSHNLQSMDDEARKLLIETCPNLLFEILDAFGK